MLAKAQEARQILDEEQLAFLANPGILEGQAIQKIIPNNAAFHNKDLDTYDSDCDDVLNAKAILMANISNYGSDVISEIRHSETYLNDMENQIDKQCLVISKKELLLEIDRRLQQSMSQDILLTVMNSMSLIGESVNMERKQNESCDNQNALEILEYFQNNDLKAQLQDKDTTV
nr:hypothetical protein [Tanacetum cinerariifolium]